MCESEIDERTLEIALQLFFLAIICLLTLLANVKCFDAPLSQEIYIYTFPVGTQTAVNEHKHGYYKFIYVIEETALIAQRTWRGKF